MVHGFRFFSVIPALLITVSAAQAETLLVTSEAPNGDGSLQAALSAAAASPEPSLIVLAQPGMDIALSDGLVYDGPAAVTLVGNGARIASDRNVTLLSFIGASGVSVSGIALIGPGEWSIENRADLDGALAGKGLFVDVADTATGTVDIVLDAVRVEGVAGHGIHISDCTLADACGAGSGGEGDGSDAGIHVSMRHVTLVQPGTGRFDADGLRVDERGPGDIRLDGAYLDIAGVGADGIELDEGQDGSVFVHVFQSAFTQSGGYCDPALLAVFMPEVPEGTFEVGVMASAVIPPAIVGSPDDTCFERAVQLHDDGSVAAYEFAIDVDDGFDVDEAGPGDIVAVLIDAVVSFNLDEGLDFDEAGPGDLVVALSNLSAEGNADDALKFTEENDGGLLLNASVIEAVGNGGAGLVAEEDGGGDVDAVLTQIATVGNASGDLGVEIVQASEGTGLVYVIDSEIADGIITEGAALDAD